MQVIIDSIFQDVSNKTLNTKINQLSKDFKCNIYFENFGENLDKEHDLVSIINISTAIINLVTAILLLSLKSKRSNHWNLEKLKSVIEEKMLELGKSSYEILRIENLSDFKAKKFDYCKVIVKTDNTIQNIYVFNNNRIIAISPREINPYRF